jgi:hypothetical protein
MILIDGVPTQWSFVNERSRPSFRRALIAVTELRAAHKHNNRTILTAPRLLLNEQVFFLERIEFKI